MQSSFRKFVTLKIVLGFTIPFLFSSIAKADYLPPSTLTVINAADDGSIMFSVSAAPPGTCNFWGFQFRFDGKTTAGKNMYASLMLAKAANKQIDVVYSAAANPGTFASNNPSACTTANMSKASTIVVN
jgi:hypothetical protein